jgi:hypothetical protein
MDRDQADLLFIETVESWLRGALSHDARGLLAAMVLQDESAGESVAPGRALEPLIRHFEQAVRDFAQLIRSAGVDEPETAAIAASRPASVGTTGDSYDNALAESIIGLYKTEVIRRRGPWRNVEAVEFATLEWVDWFNNRRLLEPIGNVPPAELEQEYYRSHESHAMAA